jgi:hypothetical protein
MLADSIRADPLQAGQWPCPRGLQAIRAPGWRDCFRDQRSQW